MNDLDNDLVKLQLVSHGLMGGRLTQGRCMPVDHGQLIQESQRTSTL